MTANWKAILYYELPVLAGYCQTPRAWPPIDLSRSAAVPRLSTPEHANGGPRPPTAESFQSSPATSPPIEATRTRAASTA